MIVVFTKFEQIKSNNIGNLRFYSKPLSRKNIAALICENLLYTYTHKTKKSHIQSFPILIEKNEKKNLTSERFCKFGMDKIDNEVHFLLCCTIILNTLGEVQFKNIYI